MFEDFNEFLILAIPLGIIIIPLIIGFIIRDRNKPRLPKKYYEQFDKEKLAPPKNISPFEASYIIDNWVNHTDIRVLLYQLLKKNIIHVVPIGNNKYNRDYVFMFQEHKDHLSQPVDSYECILIEALWTSDAFNPEKVLSLYPYLDIKYPICRLSKLKKPTKKLIYKARKNLEQRGLIKQKQTSQINIFLLILLIPILFLIELQFSNDPHFSIQISVLILFYIAYLIIIHLPLTKSGTQLKRELAGFKHYLHKVEGDRMVYIRKSPALSEDEYHLRYFEYILAFNILGMNMTPKDWCKVEHSWYDEPKTKSFNDLGSLGDFFDHIRSSNKIR